ncbi:PAS-domain containing protein [Thioclava sp. FR2]|uniref:PAS-domain containing protein n=1 Tax=Thioclava sp. FR2 TaxID=3445780 RepID=UPI003EBEC267
MTLGLGLGITAILAAFGSLLFLIGSKAGNAENRSSSIFDDANGATIFLFDGEALVDCTPGGRAVLAASLSNGTAWQRLMAHLGTLFPEVEQRLTELSDRGVVTLEGEDREGRPMLLRAELRGGLTRILLTVEGETGDSAIADPLAHRAMTEELSSLRGMMTHAPMLAWRERADGAITWANTLYVLKVAESLPKGHELTWPLPHLFDPVAATQGAKGQRQKLTAADGSTKWFELSVIEEGGDRKHYALACDAAVAAENTLRDLMQTLTKTFAHLSVGLAVFDSKRQLQMFNPALLDLTGLAPDFLSSRPTVLSMLDAMRDNNMVPEPKDYRRWRQQLVEMEGSGSTGIYSEVWTLAGGQTYRVVGRPHSNGSLALMFEDISTEVSRTRRYRADLELGQSVVDAMEESIAVFSETGHLVMTNRAYATLWGEDPSVSLVEIGIRSAITGWADRCAPSPIWKDVQDFVATIGDRDQWSSDLRMDDGRGLRCRLVPLEGGATMIGFRVIQAEAPKLTAAKRAAQKTA